MAVAGLSFEELEFSPSSLLLLLLAFCFLSPLLLDFSLLDLFLPAIALGFCKAVLYVESVRGMMPGFSVKMARWLARIYLCLLVMSKRDSGAEIRWQRSGNVLILDQFC